MSLENENWMYYKLIHANNPEVELLCCININTLDDDEVECEWMQNDGTWEHHVPHYWSEDNEDLTPLLDELISISAREWDVISQALVDCEDTVDEVFVHEFKNCTLLVSYDDSFDEYYLSSKKLNIQIDGWVKKELDQLKIHERQPYNEVIRLLLNRKRI